MAEYIDREAFKKSVEERYYYGYPVIAIAFAWLCWRCKVEIGVRKHRR